MNVLSTPPISIRLTEPAISLINRCLGSDVLNVSRDLGESLVVRSDSLNINYRPKGLEMFCTTLPQRELTINVDGSVAGISPDIAGRTEVGCLLGDYRIAASGVQTVIDALLDKSPSSEVSMGLRAALGLS